MTNAPALPGLLLLALSAAAPVAASAPAEPAAAAPMRPAEAGFDRQFKAAQQLAREGQRDAALAAFTALLARSPGNADVLVARGRLHAWAKRWPEAESDLVAATRAEPRYADAWSALGDLYHWSDRPQQAATAYERWAALAPQDPAPRLMRGRMLRLAGDDRGARVEFEAARHLGTSQAEIDRARGTPRKAAVAPDAVAAHGYDWTSTVHGARTWVSGTSSDYENYHVAVRRHWQAGSLALEALGVHRFDERDVAYALDGYADVWSRAYANIRLQLAPDHTLFAENSGRVEVYQGVGQGWEVAGSYDWLNFTGTSVGIYGAALAKYWRSYYGRLRTTYVDPSGSVGWRLTLRDYYRGDADHYWELTGGTSRSDVTVRGITELQWSRSAGIAWLTFLGPEWGLKVGADYSDGDLIEKSVSATLYTRW